VITSVIMSEFKTKDEVDQWYDAAVGGVGRAGAIYIKNRDGSDSEHLLRAITALAEIKTDIYKKLAIAETPQLTSLKEAVRKHYQF